MTSREHNLSSGGIVPASSRIVADEAPPPAHECRRGTALSDLREQAMNVSAKVMEEGLEQYWDRRATFYRWLLSKLSQGVHFGVPPGVSLQNTDPLRWRSKPSLYKAGADFISDLMGLREEYSADLESWQQLGSPKEVFVRKCRLFSRLTGQPVGEGTGARRIGEKKMTEANSTIKMADKSAKVAAIINSYGLSDLFSQDIEDLPQHENPIASDSSPKPRPRDARQASEVDPQSIKRRYEDWVEVLNEGRRDWPGFCRWAAGKCNDAGIAVEQSAMGNPGNWSKAMIDAVAKHLPGGAA